MKDNQSLFYEKDDFTFKIYKQTIPQLLGHH